MTTMQPEPEQERELTIKVEVAETPTPQQRNFVIPGCSVTIDCDDDEGMPVEQLLAIVFNLAAANPGARVDFGIKVLSQ